MKHRIVKVVCWRLLSILITMVVMWCATGNIREATGVTLILHALLTIANYGFEVAWDDVASRDIS